ncbi:hypothetical protein HanPI659440_Chr17g0699391 [Helianthus annuus]|nr:hypothetical protein HanPI659440_Chr17g0699391 [Helianthus annuus]
MLVDKKGEYKAFIAKIVREPDMFATWMRSMGENVKSEEEKSVTSDGNSESIDENSESVDESLQSSDENVQNVVSLEKEVVFDQTPSDSSSSDADSEKSV